MAPRSLNHSTLQWHPAMAPRPMAFWCHVQCAKVVRRPPPPLEVRTPIAIAIWGFYMIYYCKYMCSTCRRYFVANVKSWAIILQICSIFLYHRKIPRKPNRGFSSPRWPKNHPRVWAWGSSTLSWCPHKVGPLPNGYIELCYFTPNKITENQWVGSHKNNKNMKEVWSFPVVCFVVTTQFVK